MRKLSVPYTIVRGGVYYLNLRWNNQFIRQSLATKDLMEAFQKVNQLAPIFSNSNACDQALRKQVSEVVGSGRPSKGSPLTVVQTDAQNEASFKQLIEVIGDIPITAVTKSVVRGYKQTLLSYPANRYKGKRKEKTLEQLVEEGCVSISLETVRNIMGRVSSFFNWLVMQGYISMNGAAARKCQVGDRIIIATYAGLSEAEAQQHKPKLVYLNQDNTVERTTNTIAVQPAV